MASDQHLPFQYEIITSHNKDVPIVRATYHNVFLATSILCFALPAFGIEYMVANPDPLRLGLASALFACGSGMFLYYSRLATHIDMQPGGFMRVTQPLGCITLVYSELTTIQFHQNRFFHCTTVVATNSRGKSTKFHIPMLQPRIGGIGDIFDPAAVSLIKRVLYTYVQSEAPIPEGTSGTIYLKDASSESAV